MWIPNKGNVEDTEEQETEMSVSSNLLTVTNIDKPMLAYGYETCTVDKQPKRIEATEVNKKNRFRNNQIRMNLE